MLLPSRLRWQRWALTVAGVVYIVGLCSTLLALRGGMGAQGRAWLLTVCAVTWGCDTAAFFVGRALGRRPFFPAISPKKTLEGTIGGLVGGTAITVGVAWAVGLGQPLWLIALIGLIMALEAGGSERRSRLVARGCAAMVLLYFAAVAIPLTRSFFALTLPDLGILAIGGMSRQGLVRAALMGGGLGGSALLAWLELLRDVDAGRS